MMFKNGKKLERKRKGIILAAGTGSRLFPISRGISKHLLPVYDKPCIYYPLSTLMLGGINEILVIVNASDLTSYERLLGSGEQWGIRIKFAVQLKPRGIAEAFLIAEEFIGNGPIALILGDNIFYGDELTNILIDINSKCSCALVFAYPVSDPENYGTIDLDDLANPISIEEKPLNPKSNLAVTGLYFYESDVVELAKHLKPSQRNELEITDINRILLEAKKLSCKLLGRGMAWLDTGSSDSLLDASQFIAAIERRQGLKIACLEEIALRKKWISTRSFVRQAKEYPSSSYGNYLRKMAEIINKEEVDEHD